MTNKTLRNKASLIEVRSSFHSNEMLFTLSEQVVVMKYFKLSNTNRQFKIFHRFTHSPSICRSKSLADRKLLLSPIFKDESSKCFQYDLFRSLFLFKTFISKQNSSLREFNKRAKFFASFPRNSWSFSLGWGRCRSLESHQVLTHKLALCSPIEKCFRS